MYCDFASELVGPHVRAGRVGAYVQRLLEELAAVTPLLSQPLRSIYVGGGTPTALPRAELLQLVRSLGCLQRSGSVQPLGAPGVGEFTVEANPGTVDGELLQELTAAGVTRLSLGVQSFSPRLRGVLGRHVSQADVEAALAAVQAVGWKEWNLDLVCGIRGQTQAEATADIDRAVAARPTHVSLYDLTYTERYRAWLRRRGQPEAAEGEVDYRALAARLVAAGYVRYEISNFALPGHECCHNLAYWQGEDYVGIGAAAVSTVGLRRWTNPRSVAAYLAAAVEVRREGPLDAGRGAGAPAAAAPPRPTTATGAAEVELLEPRVKLWEKAMLGLRTARGVGEEEVAAVLDQAAVNRLLERGCLERRCGKIRINSDFLDVSNSVITAVLV